VISWCFKCVSRWKERGKEVANSGCEGKGNYLWGERGGIRGEKEENG